jgi:hypothetical protein
MHKCYVDRVTARRLGDNGPKSEANNKMCLQKQCVNVTTGLNWHGLCSSVKLLEHYYEAPVANVGDLLVS